jgi:hypothetical protein
MLLSLIAQAPPPPPPPPTLLSTLSAALAPLQGYLWAAAGIGLGIGVSLFALAYGWKLVKDFVGDTGGTSSYDDADSPTREEWKETFGSMKGY